MGVGVQTNRGRGSVGGVVRGHGGAQGSAQGEGVGAAEGAARAEGTGVAKGRGEAATSDGRRQWGRRKSGDILFKDLQIWTVFMIRRSCGRP